MKHRQTGRSRILVVDDEQVIALTLSAILEDEGYEVKTALSGEDAVASSAMFSPDLLLTDISMGAMSGIEAAAQITDKLPKCRVLFLSGHTSMHEILESPPEHFVFSFMSKPVHVPDLLNAIAYMLPEAITVSDPPMVEIEYDPTELHTLAMTALARLDARRMERPNRPCETPENDCAAGGTRQRTGVADRSPVIAANGEGWTSSRKPLAEEVQLVRSLVRATSFA